jgi:hypothetical protein
MSLSQIIYNRLTTDAAVSAIVADRVFFNVAPDGLWPLVTIDVDLQEDDAIDARAARDYTVGISCEALNSATRTALAKAVIDALDRKAWTDGATTVHGVKLETAAESHYVQDAGNTNRTYYLTDMELSFLVEGA